LSNKKAPEGAFFNKTGKLTIAQYRETLFEAVNTAANI
jgi:hypothetical protein